MLLMGSVLHDSAVEDRQKAQLIGEASKAQGELCVLTLAGGAGSRLGFDGPKGAFEIVAKGRKASLFQRQKEKVGGMPWLIMVSPSTRAATIAHFQDRVLSGSETVFLIEQEEAEALTLDGQVLKGLDGKPVLAANGNGSVFVTLQKKGYTVLSASEVRSESECILKVLERAGIIYMNIISIDNVLVRIGDPIMLGWMASEHLQVVSAAVPIPAGASMGVFMPSQDAQGQESVKICEYTDQPQGEVLKGSNGAPLGNIANHIVRIDYLKSIDSSYLPYHQAHKKIPCADNPNPTEPNAIKQELFIFDGFNLASKHGVVEYTEPVYQGLKNKEGPADSIATCTEALNNQ
ncbi:UDP-N-acetylglucosamine/UDP-N-acetylgalactosamine diphosphorylase [Nematocida homosporus]|uniref:UDP-N-acetylglucosamine/UDP-N- acetylgalactosamine diphosphorylase n=1 Tax=Nematocida homosporus TaxID=1912981 RepID=UPI002220133E|nr:UDP-N-acetylglucosamine/UDP-N-acetylgalactosamine diphosphorylase [Nematocida homosporus]KAI5187012.1 UDP-N-acetylglucosamine/UDP-N-acetylgalactosamine diphosphorylase [Nematocida homosporus]